MKKNQQLLSSGKINTANHMRPVGIDQLDLILADIDDPKCIPIIT